ncbi:MAG: aminopeptidase P family protein [Planctomycetaceae bacterium]|nr:aminopeptidase P family protein [Planctomycetaceae bacterium]
MLTKEGCLARRKRLWDAVGDDLEWLLIADPRHVLYLANFWVNPLSFSGGERGLLLLERDGGATLFGDNFALRSSATEPFVDREVVEDWYDHKHSVINRDHALQRSLQTVSERLYGRNGATEAEWLPVGAWELLGLDRESHSVTQEANSKHRSLSLDLGTCLRGLRRQKEPDEIALLTECMKATEAGHARAREIVQPGISEMDIYREVQSAALKAAGRPGLVYGDFRVVNAKTPKQGGLPTQHVLEDGEMYILDYSVVLDGYRSDFTNTLAVGTVHDQQELIFRLCEAALQAGEDFLKAGVAAKDVYATVSKPLEEAGYGPLGHHAGHGIGLAHPEPPILVPESEDVLKAGDVVTLEPGLYVEGIGGVRIENNYLITETGCQKLNNHLIALT